MSVRVLPLRGIPDVEAGDDLPSIILAALPPEELREGDVVVVTQKVVSRVEGRVVPADEDGKRGWIARETRRIVARRGDLVIAETHHGFVCANAGVDESNVPRGMIALLPTDPDASAERIRAGLAARTGRRVAVVITDTFGRPWRRGLVEVAIGCAGIPALLDLRGTPDRHGRTLEVTVVALADEVAAAAGLVMAKSEGIPVAVVRGLDPHGPPGGARDLVRAPEEDLFRHGPLEAITSRRSIRTFGPGTVPRPVLEEAVGAALTAPVPHGSRHPRPPWAWVVLESDEARRRLLDAMARAWVRDLRDDGVAPETIARRLRHSDELLGRAPILAVPHLGLGAADRYPDERRAEAEREMFLLATGAAVQNLMLALHAQGYASCWVSSTLFCKDETREALEMEEEWFPMGAVAVGPPPPGGPPPRPRRAPGDLLRFT